MSSGDLKKYGHNIKVEYRGKGYWLNRHFIFTEFQSIRLCRHIIIEKVFSVIVHKCME